MVDIAGDSTTTTSITVGGSVSDTLEVNGDHDWIRINLSVGQSITVALNGISLEDPYLRIRDVNGNIIYENDDISSGVNRNSLLSFTATYSGVYFIDVGAWDDNYSGTYTVNVTTYTPPPLATNDQIANQLVETYWGGNDHHFNVTQGGTITVNLTALNLAGANLARNALNLWSDVIGVTFQEVTTGGQITFDDSEAGAFSDGVWGGGITTSAHVNVSTQWLTDYGTSLTSYSFQAYIHEIGHALGLGHAGNYNDTARYPYDASFQNDSWATSIMSYFDPQENTYFAGQGFTVEAIVTPMVADIVAMATLYGLSTTTRAGDTTYGFNSTAGRSIYDANQFPNVAYTIFDSGGIDTLDYSGFTGAQLINLNPETFGNFGNGNVGNLVIARGVIIENAIGGSGNDTLIGNAADNILTGGAGTNRLTGGAGNDTFRDTLANLSGDTITDFSIGDRIVFTNATPGAFTFSLSGSTLTYSGGSLTLTGVSGTLVASAAAGGGVQLSIQPAIPDVADDFNGDGRSDVLWRNNNGIVTSWSGQTNGSFTGNSAYHVADTGWTVVGTGDFNGDGRDDILWRQQSSGIIASWSGQADGSFTGNSAYHVADTGWTVVGTGDFNGDGRDDILWRQQSSGTVTSWAGQTNGSFTGNSAYHAADTGWTVVGTGDFNGDGRDDILWRQQSSGTVTDWLGQTNSSFVGNFANAYHQSTTDWHIQNPDMLFG